MSFVLSNRYFTIQLPQPPLDGNSRGPSVGVKAVFARVPSPGSNPGFPSTGSDKLLDFSIDVPHLRNGDKSILTS